jgi:hypothetical protein
LHVLPCGSGGIGTSDGGCSPTPQGLKDTRARKLRQMAMSFPAPPGQPNAEARTGIRPRSPCRRPRRLIRRPSGTSPTREICVNAILQNLCWRPIAGLIAMPSGGRSRTFGGRKNTPAPKPSSVPRDRNTIYILSGPASTPRPGDLRADFDRIESSTGLVAALVPATRRFQAHSAGQPSQSAALNPRRIGNGCANSPANSGRGPTVRFRSRKRWVSWNRLISYRVVALLRSLLRRFRFRFRDRQGAANAL